LLVLSGILHAKFEISVLDALVENIDAGRAFERIRAGGFFAVISLCSFASKDEDLRLLRRIKEECGSVIVVNGGFLRYEPQTHLRQYPFLDAIITDYTAGGIVHFLTGESRSLPGIWFRGKAGAVISESSGEETQLCYPLPRHELFPLPKYRIPQARRVPLSCVLISYGCPHSCAFCSSAALPFRRRAVDDIMEELSYLRGRGIREVHFPDFTFTADREHCLAVCRAMIDARLSLGWDCLTRADCFDEELAATMKKAGCHTIQFGVETKSEALLDALGKKLSNQSVRQAFSWCRRYGIETIGFFIVGLPGDTQENILDTIAFAKELDCDYASFSVFVPDIGSGLRRRLVRDNPGLETVRHFDRTEFPVMGTEMLTREQIWKLRNQAIRSFYCRPGYAWKRLKRAGTLTRLSTAAKIFRSLLREQAHNR
jgi:Fe-S oxidoreductase